MPVPPGPGPHKTTRKAGPWHVDVHAHQGKIRNRIEDGWAIVQGARLGPDTVDAFAVFDGLGGVPHGQEAAWAAADGLADALERSAGPQDVLRRLNETVQVTGGATTAVLLLVARGDRDPHKGWMITIGDSSMYRLDGDGPHRLNPRDRVERHKLSDWLGHAAIRGHLRELAVRPGERYVLCTDGADDVVGVEAVSGAARAEDTPAGLDRLFSLIMDAGAPDNATVMVVRAAEHT